jgi:hypothetical protein
MAKASEAALNDCDGARCDGPENGLEADRYRRAVLFLLVGQRDGLRGLLRVVRRRPERGQELGIGDPQTAERDQFFHPTRRDAKFDTYGVEIDWCW